MLGTNSRKSSAMAPEDVMFGNLSSGGKLPRNCSLILIHNRQVWAEYASYSAVRNQEDHAARSK